MTAPRICRCDAIACSDDLYADLVTEGALRLVSEATHDYVAQAILVCTACGATLAFTRDDSFHTPSIGWVKRAP